MKTLVSLLLACSVLSCSNPPAPKTVETDLCKARAAFKTAEFAEPGLYPTPGSLRAQVEEAEDAFCATVRP